MKKQITVGMPMVMAMAKDIEIDNALIAEARGLAKELVG
jgi:Arc/MetJ family transcription regulator